MRNNQSKYLINDETSNYNEVTHLLRDRGIDLDHNRFLILQGEVEQIAQMKSKAPSPHEDGLLEYLEDIIGTAKYKQSIEDSLIEMDKLSDERSERLGRLRIVEKEKDRLEGYKGEAEGYLKDVNVVVRKKNKLYQRYLFDLNENIQICIEQSQQLTSDLQSKESKIKGRRQLINDLESSYNNLDKDVKKVENEMKKVSKSHEDKNKENVKLDVKIKDLNSKIKKLNKVIQDDKHSQSEAEHSLASLSEDIEKARKELDEHESGLGSEEEKLESIIDSLKGKTQQFTDQIEVKQKELQPWQAKISDKQTKIDVAQSERQLLTDKSRSAQNAVIDAEKSLEDLLNEVQIKKNSVEEINDKRNNISDQMKESEISLKDMRNKEIYARNDLASARQKADEAKASLTANRSQDAVLATLNRLRDTGRVSGFHGRLGNLGVIDDKYDVAITTACGALNNFVVDTVNAAQTCIKHLRENNVGRASFIVLEQLPKRDVGKIQTPENVPRLIDLVKVKKNNFIPAFFKALGNTLVAKDLAQGNRIAYGKQRWRVVTLQGNVIDTSGTMSGGGQRVLKGGMGSTFSNSSNEVVTIDQVHQLQSEADRLEENLHEINEKVQKIEIEYRNFEKIIPELDIEIEKAEIDQSTFKKRISESKKYVEKMKVESKPNKSDLNRIKDLDNLIESLTEEINDLKSKTEKIESEITGLQDKILEVGGVKLRAQKSKVDGIKTMMSIANETITKNEVSLTKAQKDFEKYKKSIKNNQSKLEEIENDLNEINKKNENQISKANNVKNEVESLRKTYESKVDELSELKQQLDSEASEMQSFNNFESDIKSKIEEINNMHRDSEHKVQIYNERLTKLELQDVEEEKEEENDKEKEGGDVKMDEEADVMEPIKGQSLELERYSNDDLANIETDKLKKEILRCEEKIDKSSVNLEVLNEYKKRKEEYKNRADDVQHVTKQRDEAKDKYDELRKKRLDEFMHGFTIISSKLKEMYQVSENAQRIKYSTLTLFLDDNAWW